MKSAISWTDQKSFFEIFVMFFFLSLTGTVFSARPTTDPAELPVSAPTVQAIYLPVAPTIDGKVNFNPRMPWVPVVSNNWEKGEHHILYWFRLGWTRQGIYLAVTLPSADLTRHLPTGRTPDAPFELDMNLDIQPEPKPGAPGNFRLQFIPLVEAPSKMIYESHAFKFNHYLGSDARLNDPGLVTWHELSLSHIKPDGVLTRWAKAGRGQQGLSFEAFIPWKSLGLSRPPAASSAFFDLEVLLPGHSPASWVGDVVKERESGGRMKLLKPQEKIDSTLFRSKTVMLQSPGEVVAQQEKWRVAWPLAGSWREDLHLVLTDKKGKMVGTPKSEPEVRNDIWQTAITLPDVPDGIYNLQLRDGPAGETVTEKPFFLAGNELLNHILPLRRSLRGRLDNMQNADKPAWKSGYLAKVQTLLDQANTHAPISLESFNETKQQLAEANSILQNLARGERPPPANIDYYRPGGFMADGQRGPINVVPVAGNTARLTIDAEDLLSWQVNPLIYGTFSEPVVYDRPVYDLLYAQALRNSSFEWGHPTFRATLDQYVDRYGEIDSVAARQVSDGKWVPVLTTDEDEVAAPWIGIGRGQATFNLHSESYNSRTSQKIKILDRSRDIGVAQLISLPVWRETDYRFKGNFRTDGASETVRIKLFHKGNVIDQTTFSGIGTTWKQVETTLKTPKKRKLKNGFLLTVTFDGPGTIYADQLTLFPADTIGGMDPQVIHRLRRLNTEWIRWPGGNYASAYDWKEGVGPFKDRISSPNPSWPGLPSRFFGTDEYMRLVRETNLEPMITVNAGTGTPEDAADWVEYANGPQSTAMGLWRRENGHPDPYAIKYWNIGNELWGSWQKGYCTPADYVSRYRAFSESMNRRDSGLEYIAIGVGPFSLGPRIWTDMLIDSVETDLDIIDFHAYVGAPYEPELDVIESLNVLTGIPAAFEQGLMTFRREAVEKGRGDVQLIVGEYNSGTGNLPYEWRETADLLSYAGWLHGFIRQGEYVAGANATEYSVFDPRAEAAGTVHPRYDLFRLYNKFIGTCPVRATLETPVRQSPHDFGKDVTPVYNLPVIDAVVLRDSTDGSIGIGMVNRDPQKSRQVEITLNNFNVSSQAIRYVFVDTGILNKSEPKGNVEVRKKSIQMKKRTSVTIPPASVSLIKIFSKSK